METKTKVTIVVVYSVVLLAAGYYAAPEKTKIETKIVEVEKKTQEKTVDESKDTHKETTTVETVNPDGSKTTTTTTVEDTKTDKKTDSSTSTEVAKAEQQSKEVTKSGRKVNLSALVGTNIVDGFPSNLTPVYGAHLTTGIVGPVTCGLFALSNGTAGVSVGLGL